MFSLWKYAGRTRRSQPSPAFSFWIWALLWYRMTARVPKASPFSADRYQDTARIFATKKSLGHQKAMRITLERFMTVGLVSVWYRLKVQWKKTVLLYTFLSDIVLKYNTTAHENKGVICLSSLEKIKSFVMVEILVIYIYTHFWPYSHLFFFFINHITRRKAMVSTLILVFDSLLVLCKFYV